MALPEDANTALLPAGLRDELPPDAEIEADVIAGLLAVLRGHGYERVKPPLVEFEESLLAGPGAGMAPQTFRLMDPVSQRMMGVRADITPQIARVAATRLGAAPRPLRLCYAGQVLRVRGGQLRPERQFAQAGAELIGAPEPAAEAEIVLLAAVALGGLGVPDLSIDFCVPTLVPILCRGFGFEAAASERLRAALDAKDAAALAQVPGRAGELLRALLAAAGPAQAGLARLRALDLPAPAAALRERLDALVALVAEAVPDLSLTVDPGECRGFEYQSGIGFTLFAKGVRGELGRGGRYALDGDEPAVGFTVYLDTVIRALPPRAAAPLVYLPHGVTREAGEALRAQGLRTIQGLGAVADPEAEARRLGCTHLFADDAARPLD